MIKTIQGRKPSKPLHDYFLASPEMAAKLVAECNSIDFSTWLLQRFDEMVTALGGVNTSCRLGGYALPEGMKLPSGKIVVLVGNKEGHKVCPDGFTQLTYTEWWDLFDKEVI